DAVGNGHRCVLQDGGVRRPRVLHVEIDLARRDGLMAHERAAQVEAALDRQPRTALDLLRHDFAQQVGLGEVLGADHDPVAVGAVPTLTPVATRTPARITPKPSGSSTWVRSCQSVIPIPRPASRTAGSTPAIPV